MDLIRFLLVLGCLSPLFILWAIRGIGVISFEIYFPLFMLLATMPSAYLAFRVWQAMRMNDRKRIVVHSVTDNREHLLIYIFAMLIPLYDANVTTTNDLFAVICALLFVIFIFGHMHLYYMNFWFAFFGYRVLTVKADPSKGDFSIQHVLITRRDHLPENLEITPLRITDFFLFDK